jgi:hypothetical protein
MFPDYKERLLRSPATGAALRKVAETAKSRIRAPSGQVLSVRAGVGRRGAFSQVVMTGPRAIFVEFGTRFQRALAPIRSAIFGMKGVRK